MFTGEGNKVILNLSPVAKDKINTIKVKIQDDHAKSIGKNKIMNRILEMLDSDSIKKIVKTFELD